MSRDEGFQFMRLGRNVERADMTSRVLDVSYAINLPYQHSQAVLNLNPADLIWMSVLHALSAHQMYRRHVGVHARGHKVLGFLLNDPLFPRSVRHCLHEIQFALGELPGAEPMRRLQGMLDLVDRADYRALATNGLHAFCDDIQVRLADLNAAISQTYFRAAHPQKMTQSLFSLV
ncbi:MAG: alpha-E domain-containing protein [Thiobacillus sp.]|nr:alpha-E domain-containing protein [Thiobacillus sp.]